MVVIPLILFMLLGALLLYLFLAGPKLPPETDAIIARVRTSELPEIITGETGFAVSDGLRIWYECISPEGAAQGVVLLLMGTGGNALFWPARFIRAFVDSGYQVIRYDHRGTGVSDRVENWSRHQPYTVADMAGDALAVLDALDVQKTHLVGLSMGGMIAQEFAIRQPDRVASLTLIMTSAFIGDPDLPGLTSRYFLSSLVRGIPLLKYRLMGGEKNLIKEYIAKLVAAFGAEDLDIQQAAELVLYDLRKRRGINLKAVYQHQAAVTVSGSRCEQLKTLNVPTLVIHGSGDQLIPVEHGQKLVELIPDARGLWIDGAGHIFPLPNMDEIHRHILANFRRSP